MLSKQQLNTGRAAASRARRPFTVRAVSAAKPSMNAPPAKSNSAPASAAKAGQWTNLTPEVAKDLYYDMVRTAGRCCVFPERASELPPAPGQMWGQAAARAHRVDNYGARR